MLSKPYAWREGDEEARGVLDPVVVLLAAEGMSSSRRRGSISSGSISFSSPRPRKGTESEKAGQQALPQHTHSQQVGKAR